MTYTLDFKLRVNQYVSIYGRGLIMKGFLLNSATIFARKGVFVNHHYNIFINRRDRQNVQSFEVGLFNKTDAFKKALGEFYEREVLINGNNSKERVLSYQSLTSLTSGIIAKGEVIFENKYIDSSGMASHRSSNLLIKAAFYEFFERQSFIVSNLTRRGAEFIKIEDFKESIENHRYLMNYVDEVHYFNISLSAHLNVVLCLGFGSFSKCIGLGTSLSIEEAIDKSQKEALLYFSNSKSKKYLNGLDNNISESVNYNRFSQLEVSQFINHYSYLLNDARATFIMKSKKLTSVFKLISIISKELNMDPSIVFLNVSRLDVKKLKVAKIIDLKWFPNMSPKTYSEETYRSVETKLGCGLNRELDWIPFP